MNKKFVLFAAGAVVVAGGLVYILGVYPPASTRDAQGAIGQRQVYRDPQAHDAAVTPGSAPVAASTLTAAQTKRIQEISSQIAAGFVANLRNDLSPAIQTQLIALLAHSDVAPNLQPQIASSVSQDFTADFMVAIQQQLIVAIQADLVQAVTTGELKGDLSQQVQQELVAQIASSVASGFYANVSSQLSSSLYNQLSSSLNSGISSGMISQIASNVASQVAPGFASQYSSSLAQSLSSQLASGLRY